MLILYFRLKRWRTQWQIWAWYVHWAAHLRHSRRAISTSTKALAQSFNSDCPAVQQSMFRLQVNKKTSFVTFVPIQHLVWKFSLNIGSLFNQYGIPVPQSIPDSIRVFVPAIATGSRYVLLNTVFTSDGYLRGIELYATNSTTISITVSGLVKIINLQME
jgi:hypothetical protein